MRSTMVVERKPVKCRNCFDFFEKTVDWRKGVSFKSTAFLDYAHGKIRVSRNGLAFIPNFHVAGTWFGFGASVYSEKEKVAYLILVPEGFE
ncbi:hypothetical protein HY991_02350 [Candidatus Micrarchaeota archaeon]|nr:hypothetical protein [Candidatus Micrarchaeota archaeon]